jgi:calcineurin-like phosphoesterase family protein
MRYWTSDLHLGHKNIIDYCKRQFLDKEDMTQKITAYLLSVLKDGDELVVVGDVALNPKFAHQLGEALSKLGVTLTLIMGNHDSCFPQKGKEMHASNQRGKFYQSGWKNIHLHWETKLKDGTHVLVSHLPYDSEDGKKYDQRYIDYRPKDKGSYLIHGHLHGKYKKWGRMVDVGFDPHEGKILSEDELIALIHDARDFVPCHLTEHHEYRRANGLEKTEMKGLA